MMLINNDLRYDSCPLCASKTFVKVGDIAYSSPLIFSTIEISLQQVPELWSCRNCKSAFTQNAIPKQIAASLYECGVGGERWRTKPFKEAKHREVIETLDMLFHQNAKVLDIGCNTGELLDYAKSRGCFTAGVEFSKASRIIIEQKGHQSFSSISEVTDCYDVITGFDLAEHLYDAQDFFLFCKRKLTKHGRVVLLTGNISSLSARITGSNWWYVKYPEHILFPSKKYFRLFSGYQIDKWVHTYASIEFDQSLPSKIRNAIVGLLTRSYTALPSLSPDHILVVLKK